MISIETKSHIGADGTLSVQVPTALRETDVEVTLTVQPVSEVPATPRELGWLPGFFEETAGAWQGEPLERDVQEFFEETYGSLRDDPIERLPQCGCENRRSLDVIMKEEV